MLMPWDDRLERVCRLQEKYEFTIFYPHFWCPKAQSLVRDYACRFFPKQPKKWALFDRLFLFLALSKRFCSPMSMWSFCRVLGSFYKRLRPVV